MQDREDIEEVRENAEIMKERLDDSENYIESIAPAIIEETLGWVLEDENAPDFLEGLREDIIETEDGVDIEEPEI